MDKLYKITKIKYERRVLSFNPHTYSDYVEVSRRVDYRTHRGAVTLSKQYAEWGNQAADRYDITYPDRGGCRRYEVIVEVADMPEFVPYEQ